MNAFNHFLFDFNNETTIRSFQWGMENYFKALKASGVIEDYVVYIPIPEKSEDKDTTSFSVDFYYKKDGESRHLSYTVAETGIEFEDVK